MRPGDAAPILIRMLDGRFDDPESLRAMSALLTAADRGAADVGEILATADRILDRDADTWVREWTATAGSAWTAAKHADADGRRVSALANYRRAASYYAAALSRVPFSREPARGLELWSRQRDCWDRSVALLPEPGQRIAIAYGGTALPGYFFPAAGSQPRGARPVVVVDHGGEEPTSVAWTRAGAAASERGYHWMTFDGPGQQAALVQQRLFLRPDWEAVLTPVADALAARPDVDAARMAVIGLGAAGHLVPRALAFEHRFAAGVADPGILDLGAPWAAALTEDLRMRLAARDVAGFDQEMHLAELFTPDLAVRLAVRSRPLGPDTRSRYRAFESIAAYRLGDELEGLRTPLLVCDRPGDRDWAGQGERLVERIPGRGQLLRFAGDDCTPPPNADGRILDWLDDALS